MKKFITKCWAQDPSQRPQSFAEVIQVRARLWPEAGRAFGFRLKVEGGCMECWPGVLRERVSGTSLLGVEGWGLGCIGVGVAAC